MCHKPLVIKTSISLKSVFFYFCHWHHHCYLSLLRSWQYWLITFFLGYAFLWTKADIVEVTILQTTDIHAHIAWDRQAKRKGDGLKLATLIRKERAKSGGKERCLLIDCGDTAQGSLIGVLSRGSVAIDFLNAMEYDAWVPGNHDLDFGVPRFKEFISACNLPVLNGNLTLHDGPVIPAFHLYEKSGATIAVIGMNSSFLPNWLWGESMEGYTVKKASEMLEFILLEVMDHHPDMIILALHQGLVERSKRNVNEIKIISRKFPQIDLILGGHTHREFPGRKIGHSWYVQAGKHAEFLGKIKVKIDTEKHHVLDIQSQLLPSWNEKQDMPTRRILKTWLKQARTAGNKRLWYMETDVSSKGLPGHDCPMSQVISQAISWKTGAPVVFHGVLSSFSWRKSYFITENMLFDTIPYQNGVGVAMLSFDEIKRIIEEQFRYKGHRAFNGIWGIEVFLDENFKVKEMQFPQQDMRNSNGRVLVAFNSYTIASGGGRFPRLKKILHRPGSNLTDTKQNTRDIVREYMLSNQNELDLFRSWFHLSDK